MNTRLRTVQSNGRLLLESVAQSRRTNLVSLVLTLSSKDTLLFKNTASSFQAQAEPTTPVDPGSDNLQQPSTNLAAGDEDRYKNMGDEVRTCNCIGCNACKFDGCTNQFKIYLSCLLLGRHGSSNEACFLLLDAQTVKLFLTQSLSKHSSEMLHQPQEL